MRAELVLPLEFRLLGEHSFQRRNQCGVVFGARRGIGKPIDEVALNQALFEKEGVEIIGVILNKVMGEKVDYITDFARRGLNLNAYNAYQSIIRGGHTFLTIRASDGPVRSMGDRLDVLIPLNQDTMDRHLRLMTSGSCVLFDSDKIKPGTP